MRKIFTLLILLLLLPLAAWAVDTAPQTLYVGSTTITAGYWTSSDGGTTWTNIQPSDPPSGDSYIHYNGQGTLELHNASIQGGSNAVSAPYGSGIYALSHSGQPVSLTIKLIGENTITGFYGIFLDAEASETSYGTGASLTITSENNGSLQVSGLYNGIYVKSGTGNVSLTINDASVVAKTTQTYSGYAGVYVQSSMYATNSPQLSLAVDGGSLTTSASEGNDGIQFYVGSSEATGATTSLTVSDHAIVDARTGGISASRISETLPTPTPSGENSSGIVFDGTEGTVYGEVTLDESLTINQGETLTIPEGSSLNSNGKLTNNGTIIVKEGGKLEGEPGGTVVSAPTIGTQPADKSVTEGETATFTVNATGSDLSYQWQQNTNGSAWTDITGETNATYTIATTTMNINGTQYRCVVSNSAGSVTSNAATLTVNAKPTYTITAVSSPAEGGTATTDKTTAAAGETITLIATPSSGYYFVEWKVVSGTVSIQNNKFTMPAENVEVQAVFGLSVTSITLDKTELSLYTGDSETLTATIEPDNATNQNVTWSSDNEAVATVDQNGTVTAVGAGKTTISVTTEDGGKTATCQVTVLHSNLKYFERKEASCTEPGNIEYWYCEGCNKYFSDEAGTTEIKLEDVVIPATGHHYVNGYCTKCGHRDPDYRPDPISYYNIYVEDVCDGVEVSTSKQVVREGGSINVYVEKDTARYTFDNFKVYYKRSYYGTWDELKEGTQPGEYPIKNIWNHIYIKAEGAEEKEDPTGIESIEGVKVYTKDGSLYVQTPQREQIIIVSMTGAVVKNEEQVGLKQYHGLQPGIYVVRIGEKAYKLRLH